MSNFPELPCGVTSFGGAVLGDSLYLYGGHIGTAHVYSTQTQSGDLLRLNLQQPTEWEVVASGPRLQGLALTPHANRLIRIGGFTALNGDGEEHDLKSSDSVASFDLGTNTWSDLPSLPEGRSSHDAVVINDSVYVVGGWRLHDGEQSAWMTDAFVLDLSQSDDKLVWKPLPTPSFHRRALALASLAGQLVVIGGMQNEGGPTTRVDIYDPQTRQWREGSSLQGEPMEGFGVAAWELGGVLYVSSYSGKLQALTSPDDQWQVINQTRTARCFHRLLPLGNSLMMVGGTNMEVGRFRNLETISVSPS